MEKNRKELLIQMISKRIKGKKIANGKKRYKKTKRIIKKKNMKKKTKKYSGGYNVTPPPKIKSEFAVENPKVDENATGDPYQRTNQKLQDQNQQQVSTNKSINGNGGTRNKKKKYIKKSLKKYIGNKIIY